MIAFLRKNIVFLSLLITLFSCGSGNSNLTAKPLQIAIDTVSYEIIGMPHRGVIVIKDTINLNNRRCTLPEGIALKFKGGVIKNGTLVGNKTKINCEDGILDHVRILGSWVAPVIKTSCFTDLSYDNALKDVLALSGPLINNKIYIEEGNYQVTAYENGDVCIPVSSNTQLIINGVIKLTPNNHRNYSVIQATGYNISISGGGTIIGDKHTHTGKEGEWGMGIDLENAHNVVIRGISIKDCWGDCIYVGGNSSNVLIENCNLVHGRRQGISVTSADGVTIRNCHITNVMGTPPQYAIDIEPNPGGFVDHVLIEEVTSEDCGGGFVVYGGAENSKIGSVTIKNCNVSSNGNITVSLEKCNSATLKNCKIIQTKNQRIIVCDGVNELIVQGNSICYDKSLKEEIKTVLNKVRGVNRTGYLTIMNCGDTLIRDNKEF